MRLQEKCMTEPFSTDIDSVLERHSVIVCVGSGGVGKTTLSATLALHGCFRGKRSAVITIDPAKRLANALGLSSLDNDPRSIPLEDLPEKPRGELFAMMLDTKRTFDRLVDKYAPTEESARKILENHYYQYLSTALAGSHEYMAMEKLEELYSQQEFDLYVLDTPPSQHALDFLQAPTKLIHLIDESVLRWLFLPSKIIGASGWKALQKGTAFFLKTAERLTGFEVLKDLSDFALNFEGMYEGFRERAQKIHALLRSDQALFMIVTAPQPAAIDEALFFYRKLHESEIPCGGFIVNRVHPSYREGIQKESIPSLGLTDTSFEKELIENLIHLQTLAEKDQEEIGRLRREVDLPLFEIPESTTEIASLNGIQKILNALAYGALRTPAKRSLREAEGEGGSG